MMLRIVEPKAGSSEDIESLSHSRAKFDFSESPKSLWIGGLICGLHDKLAFSVLPESAEAQLASPFPYNTHEPDKQVCLYCDPRYECIQFQ
jgi:hypothetical protein